MKQTEAILGDMRFIPLKGVVLILILILKHWKRVITLDFV